MNHRETIGTFLRNAGTNEPTIAQLLDGMAHEEHVIARAEADAQLRTVYSELDKLTTDVTGPADFPAGARHAVGRIRRVLPPAAAPGEG